MGKGTTFIRGSTDYMCPLYDIKVVYLYYLPLLEFWYVLLFLIILLSYSKLVNNGNRRYIK